MKRVDHYIHEIKDELKGAREYAERYIECKGVNTQWAQMFHEMGTQEIQHADYLKTMAQEYINGLSYVPEECKDKWERCMAHYAEKQAVVKLMLSK